MVVVDIVVVGFIIFVVVHIGCSYDQWHSLLLLLLFILLLVVLLRS